MNANTNDWQWQPGTVDRSQAHFELRYGDAENSDYEAWVPVALIGEPVDHCFPVQWLLDTEAKENAKMVAATRRELNFYLVELGEPNPWRYAQHHCGTAANIYSKVHWSYFAKGKCGDRHSSIVIPLKKTSSE